jgi:hypothetical protein
MGRQVLLHVHDPMKSVQNSRALHASVNIKRGQFDQLIVKMYFKSFYTFSPRPRTP